MLRYRSESFQIWGVEWIFHLFVLETVKTLLGIINFELSFSVSWTFGRCTVLFYWNSHHVSCRVELHPARSQYILEEWLLMKEITPQAYILWENHKEIGGNLLVCNTFHSEYFHCWIVLWIDWFLGDHGIFPTSITDLYYLVHYENKVWLD